MIARVKEDVSYFAELENGTSEPQMVLLFDEDVQEMVRHATLEQAQHSPYKIQRSKHEESFDPTATNHHHHHHHHQVANPKGPKLAGAIKHVQQLVVTLAGLEQKDGGTISHTTQQVHTNINTRMCDTHMDTQDTQTHTDTHRQTHSDTQTLRQRHRHKPTQTHTNTHTHTARRTRTGPPFGQRRWIGPE